MYAEGITGGCGSDIYCLESNVTRAEMAIFLLRAKHGSSYTPPAVGYSTGFDDVPTTYWAAAWIKQLYAEGITGGCATRQYCPEGKATHAEMAIFLLRVKHGTDYELPDDPDGYFFDVPAGYWAEKWILQAASESISYGSHDCSLSSNGGNFCPENKVTRAEMAGMLLRARP